MTVTPELEKAARAACRALRLDPDEVIGGSPDDFTAEPIVDGAATMDVQVYGPRWQTLLRPVAAAIRSFLPPSERMVEAAAISLWEECFGDDPPNLSASVNAALRAALGEGEDQK